MHQKRIWYNSTQNCMYFDTPKITTTTANNTWENATNFDEKMKIATFRNDHKGVQKLQRLIFCKEREMTKLQVLIKLTTFFFCSFKSYQRQRSYNYRTCFYTITIIFNSSETATHRKNPGESWLHVIFRWLHVIFHHDTNLNLLQVW